MDVKGIKVSSETRIHHRVIVATGHHVAVMEDEHQVWAEIVPNPGPNVRESIERFLQDEGFFDFLDNAEA